MFSISDVGQFHRLMPDGSIHGCDFFSEILKTAQHPIEFDEVAITEFPWRSTFVGDRSIMKNIKRSQWFSHFDDDLRKWVFHDPPAHGVKRDSAANIARKLQTALKIEISNYVSGKESVGILLSGGMDSRIIAGILKSIQSERKDFSVTVFCWGMKYTRDTVYSERIATMYDWRFEHFDITPELLKRNIAICAKEGCFYSPTHLHAMPDVATRANELGMDCILAASYGDSIGRSEYSGRKVAAVDSIQSRMKNVFGLINPSVYEQCKAESTAEIDRYHGLYGLQEKWAENELDYQLHYMRNQLGTCLSIISKAVPVIQCFTSTEVVELMWSYHPDCRTDEVYLYMIKAIDPRLFAIPWARTGKRYLMDDDISDSIQKPFHRYGKWCRDDLRVYIDELVYDSSLQSLNVFNTNQIRVLNRFNQMFAPANSYHLLDEIILWLASLSIFLQQNNSVCAAGSVRAQNRFPSFTGTARLLYKYKGNIARKLISVCSLSKSSEGGYD